jgi:hypothetical protein
MDSVIWPMRRRSSFLQIELGRELINNTGGAGLPEAAQPSGSRRIIAMQRRNAEVG